MFSSFSAQSLKSYGHLSALCSRSLSVTAMLKNVDFLDKTNTAIHGLREDVTAGLFFITFMFLLTNDTRVSSIHVQMGTSTKCCSSGFPNFASWWRLPHRCTAMTNHLTPLAEQNSQIFLLMNDVGLTYCSEGPAR